MQIPFVIDDQHRNFTLISHDVQISRNGISFPFMGGNRCCMSHCKLAPSHWFLLPKNPGWNVVRTNRLTITTSTTTTTTLCIRRYRLTSLETPGVSRYRVLWRKARKVLAATLSVSKQNTRRLSNRSRGRMTSGSTHTYTDKRANTMKTTTTTTGGCCSAVANRGGCSSR